MLGILTALPDAFPAIRKPGSAFFQYSFVCGKVNQIAVLRNPLSVHYIKLGLPKGRGNFIFYNFDLGPVAHHPVAILDGGDTADVNADGGIELQGATTRGGLGVPEHDAYFLA